MQKLIRIFHYMIGPEPSVLAARYDQCSRKSNKSSSIEAWSRSNLEVHQSPTIAKVPAPVSYPATPSRRHAAASMDRRDMSGTRALPGAAARLTRRHERTSLSDVRIEGHAEKRRQFADDACERAWKLSSNWSSSTAGAERPAYQGLGFRRIEVAVMESYAALINKRILIPSQKVNYIGVEMHFLSQALRAYVQKIYVDEEWYLTRYPDIVAALKAGTITDAWEHYQLYGFYEHRMPHEILVDERWYLDQYADIRKAVDAQVYQSGQHHFEELGYKEGRIPYAHFSLKLNGAQSDEF